MASETVHCAVCPASDSLHGVIVGGRTVHLCGDHRTVLGDAMPDTYDELAALFVRHGLCRRSGRDRRRGERRMFPRPEGRRHNMGRRAADDR